MTPTARALVTGLTICVALAGCATTADHVPSSDAKAQQIARVRQLIDAGKGSPARGKDLFTARCAGCHTLNGVGGKLGPNLTHYTRDRESLDFLLASVIDPQREVHDYHTTFEIRTTDGRVLTGIILEQGADALVLLDASGQRVNLTHAQVQSRKPLLGSMMSEAALAGLSDAQVADLFAYLMKK